MKKIKIGQIGIGHNHGEGKMLAFRKFPELFDVVGYAEDDPSWIEKRGSLKAYDGLPRLSVPELLSSVDAVVVETAVPNLTETAALCIDAGKHIHLDKPGSGTLEDFGAMLSSAKEQQLVVQMGYMYRYNPAIERTIEAVRSGKLGEIYSINAEMSILHPAEYRKWLCSFKGGIQYILGSHMVDLIVYLMGEPIKVTSFLKRSFKDGIEAMDNNLSVLEYERAIAKISVSSVEVNGWGRRQFVVCGSKGSINIMPMENPTVMTYTDLSIATQNDIDLKSVLSLNDVPKDCRYDKMVQDFYKYVQGTESNPFTYEHDYAVQKTITQIIAADK